MVLELDRSSRKKPKINLGGQYYSKFCKMHYPKLFDINASRFITTRVRHFMHKVFKTEDPGLLLFQSVCCTGKYPPPKQEAGNFVLPLVLFPQKTFSFLINRFLFSGVCLEAFLWEFRFNLIRLIRKRPGFLKKEGFSAWAAQLTARIEKQLSFVGL